jgi:hypothetical protein
MNGVALLGKPKDTVLGLAAGDVLGRVAFGRFREVGFPFGHEWWSALVSAGRTRGRSGGQCVSSTPTAAAGGPWCGASPCWTTGVVRPLFRARFRAARWDATSSYQWEDVPRLCAQRRL